MSAAEVKNKHASKKGVFKTVFSEVLEKGLGNHNQSLFYWSLLTNKASRKHLFNCMLLPWRLFTSFCQFRME